MQSTGDNTIDKDALENVGILTEQLKSVIGNIDNIPTLPTVIAEVTEAIRDPRVDASHVGQIISRDQALSAKTLRLVNSAFYGFPRKITNITRAIIVMGFNKVRNLALTASVLDKFRSRDKDFDYAGLWQHSLGTAIAAEVLARMVKSGDTEDAFVSGLLHDIGKLVLALYAKEPFARIRDYVQRNDVLMLSAEMELYEIDHGLIGAWLADEWKFPPKLTRAIRMHHNPDAAREYQEIVYITHVADILCRALEIGNGGDKRIPQISETAWTALGLNEQMLDKCMGEILDGLDKAKDFLELLR